MCGQAFAGARRAAGPRSTTQTSARAIPPFPAGAAVGGGRYLVGEALAMGSTGWVLRAQDRKVGADVVLKVIAGNLLQTDEDRDRFLRAVKVARRLQHPNLATILEDGREGTSTFYTLEYLEGLTLRKIIDLRLEKSQVFGWMEIMPLLDQVSAGLDTLARTGGHGSLRPQNIIVMPDILKITGVPHLRGLPRRPFVVLQQQLRCMEYLAPEARTDKTEVDGRSDVYSLAVIVAEMLTGKVYGRHADMWEHAQTLLTSRLIAVLRGGLAENSEARFQSASEMARALFEAEAGKDAGYGEPSGGHKAAARAPGGGRMAAAVAQAGATAQQEMQKRLKGLVTLMRQRRWLLPVVVMCLLVAVAGGVLVSRSRLGSGAAPLPLVPTPRPGGAPMCPAGMATIEGGSVELGTKPNDPSRGLGDLPAALVKVPAFCIDTYEFPNQRGKPPMTNVSWSGAKALCEERGKRLCSEAEWERACKGIDVSTFPYGNGYVAGTCNTGSDGSAEDRPVRSGEFARCRSSYGVADLSGNAAEWTSTQWSAAIADRVVKGGAAGQPFYTSRCAARVNEGSGEPRPHVGFRCCADFK